MSHLSPAVGRRHIRRRIWLPLGLFIIGLIGAGTAFLLPGCQRETRRRVTAEEMDVYPPAPQQPRVVALGSLRTGAPPSQAEVDLALFLFGAEPPPGLAVANPTGLAASETAVLICDQLLGGILRWDRAAASLSELPIRPPVERPIGILASETGEYLVSTPTTVLLADPGGAVVQRYGLTEAAFRVSGAALVDDTVWVCNIAQDRIEVFDRQTGAWQRSIGGHGHASGGFALPRSITRTPEGNICVIDMLNNRIQILDPQGEWVRDIGQPGDNVGSFGRPKDVAVGPDGTFFVTDAFSQRVHAFAADGRALLAFGEPGSGIGSLVMPSGIAVSTMPVQADRPPPTDPAPLYYVLVAEQLERPGVRVYAWLGQQGEPSFPVAPIRPAVEWVSTFPGGAAINPHWDADRCDTCHPGGNGELAPIPPPEIDALCLSCHDGARAPADPHPIGRPAQTALITTPPEFPTLDGMIGCLTCHDIDRHCSRAAKRPAINSVMLRGYDPQRPLEYCANCHTADAGGRFSPHQQRDANGRIREDACFFCHTQRPEIAPDGRRLFEPHLRVESSSLCLNCHAPHWDLSPLGHVDRPVTPEIRHWMLIRELGRRYPNADFAELREHAAQLERGPAVLPLGDGEVTCYTCHNPHYAGLFPQGSELGALADHPADRASALRTNWIDLCSECHHH